jgi:putative hydrolase of the HAD superfamily
MLRDYEMMQHFDRRFASQIIGHAKPSPEIYQRVIEHLDVPPHQILFFDDKIENVRAAGNAGWNARVYHSHAALLSDLREFALVEAAKGLV